MHDGSGLIFCAWCGRPGQHSCWRKILAESLASSLTACLGSSVSWKAQGTKHRCILWAPVTSEPHTNANGSGSWPTVHGNQGNNGPSGTELGNAANWNTPTSADGGSTSRGGERKGELLLGGQVKIWPTPRASDNENRMTKPAPSHGNGHGKALAGEVHREAATWPTPSAMDGDRGAESRATKDARGSGGVNLREAANWPTPTAQDCEQAGSPNAGHLTLTRAGRADPANRNTNGKPQGSLNSRWVLQLMGYPSDWLDLPTSKLSELREIVLSRMSSQPSDEESWLVS